MILLHTNTYKNLAHKVQALLPNSVLGKVTIKQFADGEWYHRIESNLEYKTVAIIGGTINDAHTLELIDLAVTAGQLGAENITLVIPYFGYSTMERSVKDGEVIKAKIRAQLLSNLFSNNVVVEILLFDLHSEGIPYYFDKQVRTKHIYCKQIKKKAIDANIKGAFVIAATDAGRAKWVESLALEWHMQAAFVYKHRNDDSTTNVTGINADVANKTVVIYDDMIRTGGSILQAAAAYKNNGAAHIYVATTHGIFCDNALQKIQEQNIIQAVLCTDSYAPIINISNPLLQVYSIDSLIANILKNEH